MDTRKLKADLFIMAAFGEDDGGEGNTRRGYFDWIKAQAEQAGR